MMSYLKKLEASPILPGYMAKNHGKCKQNYRDHGGNPLKDDCFFNAGYLRGRDRMLFGLFGLAIP